jgi:hypothetical protein
MTPTADLTVDWTTVLLALIAFLGTALTAILAYAAQRNAREAASVAKETGIRVDGRMDELLRITRQSATAEGVLAGTAEGLAAGRAEGGTAEPTPVTVIPGDAPLPVEVVEK